jgi:hypothetical protein
MMEEKGLIEEYWNDRSKWRKKIIQSVPGGKDIILGGHSIGHSKQKTLYERVSYSERFPR